MLQRFQSFVTGIIICHRYIQRIKAMEMTEFGLKGTHVMCLFTLHHQEEGITAAQLCQINGEDKGAVSRTLAVLQERGYIQTQGSKYRARITLTPAGEAVACQVDDLIQQWVGLGGDGLTEEERAVFYRALDHISANLGEQLRELS